MSEEAKELEPLELVYLGPVPIAGGKQGHRFIPLPTLENCGEDELELAKRLSSPFVKGKGKSIGGVYRARGELNGDTVAVISFSSLEYIRESHHPLIPAFRLLARGEDDRAARERAEKRAKVSAGAMLEIGQLAALLNTLPLNDRSAAAAGLVGMIQAEAHRLRTSRRTAK